MTISAIVLAAGLSKRMGCPKMVLSWGDTTVVGKVVSTLDQAGIDPIVVVTGGARQQVEAALKGLPAYLVFNPRYAEEEMLVSLQVGLASLGPEVDAALVVLGDQPQMRLEVVQGILGVYEDSHSTLVFPSYQNHRGHPWLVSRELWEEIIQLQSPRTLRDMVENFASLITYLPVDTSSILRDLDTPQDYARETRG